MEYKDRLRALWELRKVGEGINLAKCKCCGNTFSWKEECCPYCGTFSWLGNWDNENVGFKELLSNIEEESGMEVKFFWTEEERSDSEYVREYYKKNGTCVALSTYKDKFTAL